MKEYLIKTHDHDMFLGGKNYRITLSAFKWKHSFSL